LALKCAKKTSPHHYNTSLHSGIHDGFMLSFCSCQILTLSECLNRNRDSSDQATFFQSSAVQFWRALSNCSLFFLSVVEMSGTQCGVFCCCSQSTSRLCVLWLHKCFAAYLGCNEWLFQSKLLFYQLESVGPFSSDILHQEGIFAHMTAAYWMFFPFLKPFFVNTRNGCA